MLEWWSAAMKLRALDEGVRALLLVSVGASVGERIHFGLRCASGGILFYGMRYSGFSDWLRSLVLQGYTLSGFVYSVWWCMDARLVSDIGACQS